MILGKQKKRKRNPMLLRIIFSNDAVQLYEPAVEK